MGIIIYNLFLLLYKTGLLLISPWNAKAKLGLQGRKRLFENITVAFEHAPDTPLVWMHCASLGEFEQGRPLLEALKKKYPETRIALTFFSASGYEVRKNYSGADYIFYLPMDSRQNARHFLDIIKPTLVLWVKYEYWYYYLDEINHRNIPVLLFSGLFWKEQAFFRWYGGIYRIMLKSFRHIFVQTRESRALLRRLGFQQNVTTSGDTRFDRVIEIAGQFTDMPVISAFCGTSPVVVAGSTWQDDEEQLDHFANTHSEIKFIIAPHEINAAHLAEIKKLFHNTVLFSELPVAPQAPSSVNVLVIDNIGMLSRLYKYATITYIGGGFGVDGIHNILEAAVYGKPVIFGPVHDKFIEAEELLESGGAISVATALELEHVLTQLLSDKKKYEKACSASREYVYSKKGATETIMNYIVEEGLISDQL